MKKIFDLLCIAQQRWEKTIRIMKLTAGLILFAIISASAVNSYSMTARINLNLKNATIVDIFRAIERNSEFGFFFKNEEMNLEKRQSVKVTDATIDEVLGKILDNNYSYKILDKNIVVTRGNVEVTQQQTKKVTGKVTDKSGVSLPGVSVIVKGTTTGIITDTDGKYSLVVPNNAVLSFSFVGMQPQEVATDGKTEFNIVLLDETVNIEEVVAIGYGTQKKKDLTGSVSNLSADRLLDRPALNVAQAIGGKVAGVKIIERSGAPGGNAMIRVRGTNSINATTNEPLFVVDGVVGVANAMSILNPNEIQSMDVLKDASATAIYGARGSNGVILITTKRGIAGKTQVEYNGYVTRGDMNRKFYVLNAEQMMYVTKQAWMNVNKYATSPNWSACFDASILPAGAGGNTYSEMPYLFEQTTQGGYSVPLMGADGKYYKPRFDTNWESQIFKPSTSTNHQVNIRGGNDVAKFGAFFGYSLEDGLLDNSNFRRYSGKLNGDIKVSDRIYVSTNIGVNRSKEQINDESFFSGGIARAAVEAYSILPIKYPNDPIYGSYAGQWSSNADFPAGETPHNPVHITNDVEDFVNRTQVTGDVTLNVKITPDLTFKSNIAIDLNFKKENKYAGREINTGEKGSVDIRTENDTYWQNENYFNYNKTIGDHAFTGMIGLSWSRYNYEIFEGWNSNYFDDFYGWHYIEAGTATRPRVISRDGQNSLNSYFARANYTYKGRYLFTVTGREDGSSRFGANSKYGFFPSGSFAWRINEEDFAKKIDQISNLKLRLSVGQTGNQEIGSYVTQTFISSENVVMGGAVTPGLFPSSVGNADLKWEKTTQYDAGIDLGLFRDRLTINADYYYKKTEDMLLDVPLPTSTTVGQVKKNYGTIENKGYELTIGSHNVKSKDFNWFTDVTFSANQNKIIQLGPTGADILRNSWVGGANTILREGESVASFFGLTRLGTYSTAEASLAARYGFVPGDVKYLDRNNDGVISFVSDGSVLGSAFPKWDMNVGNNFTYKNFDFSLDIKFSFGAKKENRTNHSSEDRQAMANGKNSILNAWRPDHQNTMIGQVRPGNGGAYYQTYPDTHWIEDASYVRGDGMTLGYTLPKNILHKLDVSKIRVYATAKNFFVITDYSGYDPEGSDRDNMDGTTPGMDFFMYPRPTTYTFGVNVIF